MHFALHQAVTAMVLLIVSVGCFALFKAGKSDSLEWISYVVGFISAAGWLQSLVSKRAGHLAFEEAIMGDRDADGTGEDQRCGA